MNLMSQFSERLKDIIAESGLSIEKLSKITGISDSNIYNWQSGKAVSMPNVANLIILADLFQCSMAFLLGFEEYNSLPNPKSCPPFSARFRLAIESKGFSLYKVGRVTGMNTGQYYEWINGKTQPSIDSLLRIAAVVDCSLDYLLGRGD